MNRQYVSGVRYGGYHNAHKKDICLRFKKILIAKSHMAIHLAFSAISDVRGGGGAEDVSHMLEIPKDRVI